MELSGSVEELRALAAQYGVRSVDDLPFGAQPLDRDDVEDETDERLANLAWEQPVESWQAVPTPDFRRM